MKFPAALPRQIVLACFVVVVAVSARAAARYEGATWALLDRQQVMAEAAKITPAAFPDCDDATVDGKSMRVYREDGTADCQDETYTKVLTEKGRRRNTTITLNFQTPYTTVEVVALEVIKPSGETETVNVAENSKESIDDSQMEMNIYDPNSRLLRVNIPKLEIGDTVHSVTRTNVERPIIPGEYAEDEMFEGPGYIRHATYEVHAPSAKPLRQIRLRNEIPNTIAAATTTADGGKTLVYRWDANRVPRMYEEPAMPAAIVVLQRLSVSTTADWQEVSRWAWKVDLPHIEATDDAMQQTVAELTRGLASESERTKAIFYYVSKNIRYMGITPEKDLPGFEPHDVKLTFTKKYGVCRDKAALLVSMLRAAKIEAFPVLVSYGTQKDPDVPNPFFNHEIVAVDQGNRNYLLMDPTDENTRDLLPALEGNQSYLVCRPDGDVVRTTPVNPVDQSMLRVKTAGTLDRTGAVQAHSELSFDGVNDNLYRGAFAQMKDDDRWRFFETLLKRGIPGATLKSLKISPTNLLDSTQGLRVDLDFSAANIVAFGSKQALVTIPWIGKNTGIVNMVFEGAGLEKRKYPMETYVACGVREDISLQAAPDFQRALSIPTCAPTNDDFISYERTFGFHDGKLSASRELKLKAVEFSPSQYLVLKKTLAAMDHDDRKAPLLAVQSGEHDAPPAVAAGVVPPAATDSRILQLTKELTIQDAHTATMNVKFTKRVLNYSGKKKEAEVKIPYNPATQSVRVVRAVVTSKDGKRQEIAPEEMNQMDAGWNASAKRYSGGKILVVSLPGVDIDSTIEMEYEMKLHDRAYLATFEPFQSDDACDQLTYRIVAPLGLTLRHELRGDPRISRFTTNKAGDHQVFEWQAEHLEALPSEANTPPDWSYQPGVAFFAGNPADYWSEAQRAFSAHAAHASATQKLAAKLVADSKSSAEKLIAIRNYVDRAIRLAGPSFTELPLNELSDADVTLQDGYGHGADRSILLYALLDAAGFHPQWVFTSDLPDLPSLAASTKSVPLPDWFETALVRVDVDRQTYFLGDTDQYSHLGATPHDGDMAIVPSSGDFTTVRATADAPHKREEYFTVNVTDDGKATIGIEYRYFGTEWGDKKRFFAELPPEERKHYHEEAVSQIAQGAKATSELTTNFETYPGTESFSVELDHFAVVDGRYLYFELPARIGLFPMSTDQRAAPLFIGAKQARIVQTEIALPAAHRRVLIAPQQRPAARGISAGSVSVNTKESAGHLVVRHVFELNPAIVKPDDYPALVRLESSLENKSARLLLLEAPSPTLAAK